jgi:mannose-6-phosphate isomerase-like protein (cupin superfamily)
MIASARRDARVKRNRETGGTALESTRMADHVSFSDEKMKKNALFDSPHLFYDAYCLLPGQAQKVHAHDGSDKVYFVVRGAGRFTIGEEEADLTEGTAVIARAGVPHGVRNDSTDELVLLVTMAPRPA